MTIIVAQVFEVAQVFLLVMLLLRLIFSMITQISAANVCITGRNYEILTKAAGQVVYATFVLVFCYFCTSTKHSNLVRNNELFNIREYYEILR